MRGLCGLFAFLRYDSTEAEVMCRANVHATMNISGILMSSRVRLEVNWALMTTQMLARYARRWCMALMAVLVVMVGPC